ncbi:MAG TPA: hypothetical protein VFC24_18045 [Casimicrobiaceae bacterium]|nr:hypothetical protein [Casimicrobiaceae bacterium]
MPAVLRDDCEPRREDCDLARDDGDLLPDCVEREDAELDEALREREDERDRDPDFADDVDLPEDLREDLALLRWLGMVYPSRQMSRTAVKSASCRDAQLVADLARGMPRMSLEPFPTRSISASSQMHDHDVAWRRRRCNKAAL